MRLCIALGVLGLLCHCAMAAEVANTQDAKDAALAASKQRLIAELDSRILILQTTKACLESAFDDGAVQDCRRSQKNATDELEKKQDDAQKRRLNRQDPLYKEMPKKSHPIRPNAPRAQPDTQAEKSSK